MVDCGNPSSALAANSITFSGATPGSTTYGASYSVVCISGYIWSEVSSGQDLTSERKITCQASGTWSTVAACIGIVNALEIRYLMQEYIGAMLIMICEYLRYSRHRVGLEK